MSSVVEIRPRRRRIRPQFYGCASRVAAVECCVENPLAQFSVTAQAATYLKAEVARVRVIETR
jgi:hypothetical protein